MEMTTDIPCKFPAGALVETICDGYVNLKRSIGGYHYLSVLKSKVDQPVHVLKGSIGEIVVGPNWSMYYSAVSLLDYPLLEPIYVSSALIRQVSPLELLARADIERSVS